MLFVVTCFTYLSESVFLCRQSLAVLSLNSDSVRGLDFILIVTVSRYSAAVQTVLICIE